MRAWPRTWRQNSLHLSPVSTPHPRGAGSHYPRSLFDPHGFDASDDFEAIAIAQQAVEDTRAAAAAAGRSAVSFTSAGPQQVALFPPGTAAGLVPLAGVPAPLPPSHAHDEPASAAPIGGGGGASGSAAISAAIQDARLKAAAAVAASAPGAAAARRSRWD